WPVPADHGRLTPAVVVPRPPKRTLTDNWRLPAHITNAALRYDTRIRHFLYSATEPHGTVQASIHRDMAMADVVPSEELRQFLLRFYSACGMGDFEALGEMLSTGAHLLAIGSDPNEWWNGSDVLEVWIQQTREASGFHFEPGRLTAYCAGNVG